MFINERQSKQQRSFSADRTANQHHSEPSGQTPSPRAHYFVQSTQHGFVHQTYICAISAQTLRLCAAVETVFTFRARLVSFRAAETMCEPFRAHQIDHYVHMVRIPTRLRWGSLTALHLPD